MLARLRSTTKARLAGVLALGAAILQVLVVAALPMTAIVPVLIASIGAVLVPIGTFVRRRALLEYPLGLAVVSGLLAFLVSIPAALGSPGFWIPIWVQFDIVLILVAVWFLRLPAIEEHEQAWNRSFLAGDHRRTTEYVERKPGMGERWEQKQQAQRELADPFASPHDRHVDENGS